MITARDLLRFPARSALCFLLVSLALPARGEDATAVLQSAIEAARAVDSYTCKIKIEVEAEGGKSVSSGTMSFLKPGFLLMTSDSTDPSGAARHVKLLSDGKISYTEVREGADKPPVVLKGFASGGAGGSAAPGGEGTPSAMLEQFLSLYDFQIDAGAGEEKLDGHPTDVLLGKYRKGSLDRLFKDEGGKVNPTPPDREYIALLERMMDSIRISIGKDDRFVRRIEVIATPPAAGAPQNPPKQAAPKRTTTTFYEVKLNAPLSAADFEFHPPQGAQIIDTTKPETVKESPAKP